MGCFVGSTCATLLQLLIADQLAIYSFFLSYANVLFNVLCYGEFYYHDVNADNVHGDNNLGEYISCVRADLGAMMFSLDLEYQGDCIGFKGDGIRQYSGPFTIGCLLTCAVVICYEALYTYLRSDEFDFCRGSYLACKWHLEASWHFPLVSALLLLFTIITYFFTVWYTKETAKWKILGEIFLEIITYNLMPLLVLVASAVSLMVNKSVSLDYDSDEFKNLRFKRSCRSVFWESSGMFAERLERAALLAHCGCPSALEAMLQDPKDLLIVLRCTPLCRLADNSALGSTACDGGSLNNDWQPEEEDARSLTSRTVTFSDSDSCSSA